MASRGRRARGPPSSTRASRARAEMPSGQPLALILARNLVASVTVAAFITDPDGTIIFYNDAAGELLGHRFEETGKLSREEWAAIGPVDAGGQPLNTSAP